MTVDANRSDAAAASRRPIRARGTGWARFLWTRLTSIGVSPNTISLASIAWAVGGGALFVAASRMSGTVAFAIYMGVITCIAMRSLCNMLDGMVAVEGGRASASGAIYNEFPDRVSDALFFIGAGIAAATLPWGEQLGWLAALLAVVTAYTRALSAANGMGDDFGGPMAKPARMAVLALGCGVAAIESLLGREPVGVYGALFIVCVGCGLTITLRLRRIVRRLEGHA